MKLEILNAIDKGDKVILEMKYDWDFATAVAKIFGVKYASEKDVEKFVMTILENMSPDDLSELSDEIDK